jgi:exodeoxyribonuclease VII small subunit
MTSKIKTFEDSLTRLNEIVKKIDSGELSLEQSITLYEEGVNLIKTCFEFLNHAEQKIKILSQAFDNSNKSPIEKNTEIHD